MYSYSTTITSHKSGLCSTTLLVIFSPKTSLRLEVSRGIRWAGRSLKAVMMWRVPLGSSGGWWIRAMLVMAIERCHGDVTFRNQEPPESEVLVFGRAIRTGFHRITMAYINTKKLYTHDIIFLKMTGIRWWGHLGIPVRRASRGATACRKDWCGRLGGATNCTFPRLRFFDCAAGIPQGAKCSYFCRASEAGHRCYRSIY